MLTSCNQATNQRTAHGVTYALYDGVSLENFKAAFNFCDNIALKEVRVV
jgi:hypothetical protein